MINSEKDKANEFMGLLVQNQKWIQVYISYLVPNRSDCEDILQDTLSEMWNKYDVFEKGTNFKVWGIAIARFKVIEHQRKYHKSNFHFNTETLERLEKTAMAEIDKGYLEEQMSILRQCLKQLTEKEQQFLRFRYDQDLTFQGIADRFGISMQGAYKAISVIHARLLKCVSTGMKSEGLV